MAEPNFTYRRDGFPLCPRCEEDEVYSMVAIRATEPITLEAAFKEEFRCYRCSWQGMIPPPVTCPDCEGRRQTYRIACGPDGCDTGYSPCSLCGGTGLISQTQAERIQQAKPIRDERKSRGVSLMEEAKRLGVKASEWSGIKRGDLPETPEGERAWQKRLKEIKEKDHVS